MSTRKQLTYAAGYWARKAADENPDGYGGEVDPRAVAQLRALAMAPRPRPPLVEIRCPRRGHLLLAVHSTRYGPLLWSTTHELQNRLPPARRGRDPDDGRPPLTSRQVTMHLAFLDEHHHRHVGGDAEWSPLACRCGYFAFTVGQMREAVADARRTGRTVTQRA